MSTDERESRENRVSPEEEHGRARRHDLPSDDALLEQLRRVLTAVDGVPEPVLLMAQAAYETRDLDAQLAALVADSSAGLGMLTLVRAGGLACRILTFEVEDTALDVEVTTTLGGLRLQGQFSGSTRGPVTIEHAHGVVHAPVDGLGRFRADGLPPGLLRFRWVDAGGRRTVSEQFLG